MAIAQSAPPDDDDRKRAALFFERGRVVAQSGIFEYAIEMYIKGLELAPDNVKAVQELRDLSLRRAASGGRPMGMLSRMKLPKASNPKQKMLNALALLSYHPGNLDHMLAVARAAHDGGYEEIKEFFAAILERIRKDTQG